MASATSASFVRSTINQHGSTLRELTWDNPVLVKEFRTRMRGARAYWVMLAYVLLLTLVVGSTYLNWYFSTTSGGVTRQAASGAGRVLFQLLFSFQAGLVALITPAITAGTITIEREQQTYQMLATCGLKARSIIWGKLIAAVAFVALLLTSSLPLVSLSFLLGGVSPGEVLGTYVSLALSAFVFGSIGILCSASLRATAAATVATYAAVVLFFVVTASLGANPPGSDLPFRSVNAVTAIYHSVDREPFFGTRLPSWLIGITMNLLLGLLLANVTITKLEYFDDRRFLAVRGLATTLWIAFVLFLTGNLFGQAVGPVLSSAGAGAGAAREFTVWLLGFYLGMLLLVLPIFATGEGPGETRRATAGAEPRSTPASFLAGMLPHTMFRADLPSGAPLLALWLAIASAGVMGGFLVTGRLGAFPIQSLALIGLMAVVMAAFTGLGNYLSVAFRDRKAAMVLTFLTIAALCLLPLFGYMSWEASVRASAARLSWQCLYLSPFIAFAEMSGPRGAFWTNTPPMLLGQTPFWLVTGTIYLLLALLFYGLTLRRLARGRKQMA